MSMQAKIDAQLRALDATIGSVSPYNMGVSGEFDRSVPMDQTGRRLRARQGPKGEYDRTVNRLVVEIAEAERTKRRQAQEETKHAPPMPLIRRREGSGIRQIKGPHTKDHVGAMHQYKGNPTDTFTSSTAAAFKFTDDMRSELRGRDITYNMKKDEFGDYTEAAAKYKHMSGHKQ